MVYFYGSDFTMTERVVDAQGVALDLSGMDFEIVFSTVGYNTYTASKHGNDCVNCVVDQDDHSLLYVTFDSHGLKPGPLMQEITFLTDPPAGFTGNIQDIAKKQYVFDKDTGRVILGRQTSAGGAAQLYSVFHVDFIKGDSAYRIAVNHGFVGSEEDWLVSLHAVFQDRGLYDPETSYDQWNMVNDGVSTYFSLVDGNKGNALTDGSKWALLASGKAAYDFSVAASRAEEARVTAENRRVGAETARAEAETLREQAEDSRVNAEGVRVTAENRRVEAETARARAETSRGQAEDSRVNAEGGRVTAENRRVEAETARARAETSRGQAEDSRVNAEGGRVTAENRRVEAETARAQAETLRVQAENERKAEWGTSQSGLKKEIMDATASANQAAENANSIPTNLENGTLIPAYAEDLAGVSDTVTVSDKFVIRTTAGDESIDSSRDALLLELIGGCGDAEAHAFKINAMRWNKANALDPAAWASGKTSGYLTGAVNEGVIGAGSNKLCIVRTPKCEAGEYGTAEKNNGWLLTARDGSNLKVGDGTVVGVWHCATLPASGSAVTAVTEHTFTGHTERFYLPDEGYIVVEIAGSATLADICCHLAWSKDYSTFTAYASPAELVVAVSALTSKFQTTTVNGKTCIILRGIGQGNGGIFDRVTIYPEGGGTYERNIAAQLLTGLTWTETMIEGEVVEGEGEATSGYRYTASLPTTGTYAAMRDGLIRSDIDGMTLEGYKLTYDSTEQITPATAFAGLYVDYQIAAPVTGTHSINPTGKLPNDMGTEEVIGGEWATGTIVISYMRGFKDTMRALYNEFKSASAQLREQGYTQPLYCVGAWLDNANTASPVEQDNPDALAVLGNKEWALDWRPFLVDMTAVEGETKKRPVMELKKNNWLRDIYGNWAPVVGITTAMHDECMANALYFDSEGQNQYCAAGAFDSKSFLALCQIELVDGVKKLSHPTLYKAVTENEETTYVEVTHYLMPWETTETKYSIFIGRKDEVYLLDNVVGASGKEWNGILGAKANVWDGVDLEAFALKPTGICPGHATAISDGGATKLRSFFYNYPSSVSASRGYKGTVTNCEMFYNNGHYPAAATSQIGSKTQARANNYDTTAPFPVAEGGWHARNTFLRSLETAWGTKYLCALSRFSGGINSNNAPSDEATWLARGGVRWRKTGDDAWGYCTWGSKTHGIYKNENGGIDEMVATINNSSFHSKVLENQIAVSLAAEFGISAGERFEFNGSDWWYMNPTKSGLFDPKTVAEGEMNCRVYKIVSGMFSAYNADGTSQSFDVECCLQTGLMLGCNMSGDGGPYWGGGCEIVGECKTAPSSGSYGYTLKAYIEPDQEKWVNEGNTSVNIGTKFPSGFEDKYRYAGSIVTRANSYIRRRLPNTPLPVTQGAAFGKGECGYGYMANYWGSAGKKTRVGVRSGYSAAGGNLSARYLVAGISAGSTYSYYCGSAQVLLDVN